MKNVLKILMLEDSIEDAEFIQMYLQRGGLKYDVTLVCNRDEFIEAIDRQTFDVILSDHRLPQFNSMEALRIRNNKIIFTPFLLVSGAVSEEYAVSIMKEGASDYILKDRLQRLPNAIIQAIEKQKTEQEKLKAEEELLKSNERYQLACKATADVIWDWNLITNEVIWGDGYETLFGHKLAETETTVYSWINYIHPDDKERVIQGLQETIDSNDKTSWEDGYRFKKADGTYATVLDKGVLIRGADSKPNRMVGAMKDITEITKTNNDLKQFSFIISHNLNAPLSNMLSIIANINHQTLDDFNANMFDMMRTSTIQLKETIGHLIEILIIKDKSLEIADIKLEEIINKTTKTLKDEINKINAQIILKLSDSYTKSNKTYLESIFLNLFSNALKYRSLERPLEITITSESISNERTQIRFSDNGIGIDMKRHKESVFGLYQRFHESIEGKGIGLFLIKSQITALAGTIYIESEVGKGTSFIINI
jgi:PAS domain S-box-containing protein